ncbi:MAG: hypothetical protein LBM13_05550 [Candidatus Ancillula sp.]|jgi:hypothetical protein|nr:hypothetical protein [Candidatus Ancillula sp.]
MLSDMKSKGLALVAILTFIILLSSVFIPLANANSSSHRDSSTRDNKRGLITMGYENDGFFSKLIAQNNNKPNLDSVTTPQVLFGTAKSNPYCASSTPGGAVNNATGTGQAYYETGAGEVNENGTCNNFDAGWEILGVAGGTSIPSEMIDGKGKTTRLNDNSVYLVADEITSKAFPFHTGNNNNCSSTNSNGCNNFEGGELENVANSWGAGNVSNVELNNIRSEELDGVCNTADGCNYLGIDLTASNYKFFPIANADVNGGFSKITNSNLVHPKSEHHNVNYYWTRSPSNDDKANVITSWDSASVSSYNTTFAYAADTVGFRPAFRMSLDNLLLTTPDDSGAEIFTFSDNSSDAPIIDSEITATNSTSLQIGGLNGSSSGGKDHLVYKILDNKTKDDGGVKKIGTSNSLDDLNINLAGLSDGDYSLYVWSQKDGNCLTTGCSNEGSKATLVNLTIEDAPVMCKIPGKEDLLASDSKCVADSEVEPEPVPSPEPEPDEITIDSLDLESSTGAMSVNQGKSLKFIVTAYYSDGTWRDLKKSEFTLKSYFKGETNKTADMVNDNIVTFNHASVHTVTATLNSDPDLTSSLEINVVKKENIIPIIVPPDNPVKIVPAKHKLSKTGVKTNGGFEVILILLNLVAGLSLVKKSLVNKNFYKKKLYYA